jgi:hypothetical protein
MVALTERFTRAAEQYKFAHQYTGARHVLLAKRKARENHREVFTPERLVMEAMRQHPSVSPSVTGKASPSATPDLEPWKAHLHEQMHHNRWRSALLITPAHACITGCIGTLFALSIFVLFNCIASTTSARVREHR